MFSRVLAICGCALAAAAFALPAFPVRPGGLRVSVQAPKSVNSVEHLKIIASVTNNGAENVTIVNYGTVLDNERATQSFKVSKGGVEAKFTGIKLTLSNVLTESAYTVIPAGKTVTVEHDISALYDFEALGEGSFDITPLSDVPVVVSRVGSVPDLAPFVFDSTPTATTKIFGDIAKRFVFGDPAMEDVAGKQYSSGRIAKRSVVNCGGASNNAFITSAYSEGKSLAAYALNYIRTYGANLLYVDYFKTTNKSIVTTKLENVAYEQPSNRTLNCSDPYGVCSNGNTIAYTYMSGNNDIYFCNLFYTEVASTRLCSDVSVDSRNIRGGTVLHELTHAVSGTTDVGYGCAYDRGLSAANGYRNADSYNCFATQVYKNVLC